MTKLIHTMIRVRDLDRSVRFYREALELAVRDHFPFDGFSLTYLANDQSGFELELTHNQGQAEPYSHGNGYGHLAVTVAVEGASDACDRPLVLRCMLRAGWPMLWAVF